MTTMQVLHGCHHVNNQWPVAFYHHVPSALLSHQTTQCVVRNFFCSRITSEDILSTCQG